MLDELGKGIIGTEEAARIAGLSQNHIRHLLKTGKIRGRKIGPRIWITSRQEVENYLATEPRPGPKRRA